MSMCCCGVRFGWKSFFTAPSSFLSVLPDSQPVSSRAVAQMRKGSARGLNALVVNDGRCDVAFRFDKFHVLDFMVEKT